MIRKTDAYGDTPIEGFYQGAEVWVGGIFKEVIAGVIATVSPYNSWAPTGAVEFGLGTISVADTNTAHTLVLSSTGGTPAASTPASLTAAAAIIDDGFDVEQLFGPTHRMTPFNYRLYPYVSSTTKFFACT